MECNCDAGSLVFVGEDEAGNISSGSTEDAVVSEIYYAGGLDYYQYALSGAAFTGQGYYSSIKTKQRKNGEVLNTLDFAPETIIEDRDRTFVITEYSPARLADARDSARDAVPSTLYVLDDNDQFVALKVCE